MNYIKARIDELLQWKRLPKPPYERGLFLFESYSEGEAAGTVASLHNIKNEEKLKQSINWLIEFLESKYSNNLEPNMSNVQEDIKPIESTSEVTPLSAKLSNKLVKLRNEFIAIQKELSAAHEQLKELTSDNQRFQLLQSTIIPLDDKAMNIYERIEYIQNNGIDMKIAKSGKKKTKKLNEQIASTEQLKRFIALRSTMSNIKRRINKTKQEMQAPLSKAESNRLARLLIKQESSLKIYQVEYEQLKQIV